MKLPATTALLALMAMPALSAPFGVDYAKDTPETLKCEANSLPMTTPCKTMPDQSWGLGDYSVMYREGLGICAVTAKAPALTGDASGEQLRAAADALKDQIAAEYGAPLHVDGAQKDAVLAGGAEWSRELAADQRVYAYDWQFQPPQHGLRRLILTAQADEDGQSWIQVQAEAPYILECFLRRD